jgi:AP-1 complex subunit sigma 1/2
MVGFLDLQISSLKLQFQFFFLVSRQGKVRLAKWYATYTMKEKQKIIREVLNSVLNRPPKLCNFVEWKDKKIVSRRFYSRLFSLINDHLRYASLYFVGCIDGSDNELITLEIIHHFVEVLDRYFGNVCELDLIFNFHKVCRVC